MAKLAAANYNKRRSEGELYHETRKGGVDKKCSDCTTVMTNVFARRKRCPECAEVHRVKNNAIACAKYRKKKMEAVSVPKKAKTGISFDEWNKRRKKYGTEPTGDPGEVDFTGIKRPTKFDNLFCRIK